MAAYRSEDKAAAGARARDTCALRRQRWAGRYGARDFGKDQGVRQGQSGGADENDWRRGMRGHGTAGYGGQYAGMAAGLRGNGRSTRADPAKMVGTMAKAVAPIAAAAPGLRQPDERIHEDVCERLKHDPLLDASDIAVDVQAGVVTLDGRESGLGKATRRGPRDGERGPRSPQ